MEEVESGCAFHTLENYRLAAKRMGLQVQLHPHAIPGCPDGINAYEYRGKKMVRWLCFFKKRPSECTCPSTTVPAAWKPTSI